MPATRGSIDLSLKGGASMSPKNQDKEKARPEHHSGEDDVKLDRDLRGKANKRGDDDEKTIDPDQSPQRGDTGPSTNGAAPGEMRVARPEDYKDPWNPSVNTTLREHKPRTDED
jgi:hypothetical protein